MAFLVGIDVGGTFTDGTVISSEQQTVHLFKTPTTPADPSQGFMRCLKEAAAHFELSLNDFLSQVEKLAYGTTLATNTLVEGKGSPTGLLTTRGFGDTLAIARIGREYLPLDLQFDKPEALIPRHLICEVHERMDYAGRVVFAPERGEVEKAVDSLVAQGVEAVAVSFLWSFKNPRHEDLVGEWIQSRHPQLFVSLSHQIAPNLGEYERTATVAMNAILGRPIESHLTRLQQQLKQNGLLCPLLMMQSIGGAIPAETAALRPVFLISSGPAGGVLAAQHLTAIPEVPDNLIGMDMGGTTCDVSLITKGRYLADLVTRAFHQTVFVPMIDVYSIGAGGGSIAWIDMGTRLKVGPSSAGAVPGPVCYGRGGRDPAVTDADVVLGYLDPAAFLGGRMVLDVDRAKAAIAEKIARPLGMDPMAAAAGIVQIVEANMADAIRSLSIQKGYDPRDYWMISYGGAGPVHAAAIARELGLRGVIVPFTATVQSAYGIVSSDLVHSFAVSDGLPLNDIDRLNGHFARMEETGHRLLDTEGVAAARRSVRRTADLRFEGQVHSVSIPVAAGRLGSGDLERIASDFQNRYLALYGEGSIYGKSGIEVVTLRSDVVGESVKPKLPASAALIWRQHADPHHHREVFWQGDYRTTPVYRGEALIPGDGIIGPAIVEYTGTTALVLQGQRAVLDQAQSLCIEEDPG